MMGVVLIAVATMEVVGSVAEVPWLVASVMVMPVVMVLPGATWWAVGVNTRASSATDAGPGELTASV